jgi:hypothetical protein
MCAGRSSISTAAVEPKIDTQTIRIRMIAETPAETPGFLLCSLANRLAGMDKLDPVDLEGFAMSKRLEAMRANPRGDWRIADVIALCAEFGVFCEAPRGGGSHYKIGHPKLAQKLTIPSKRPIKPVLCQ